jgi:hypothetical protein
VAVVAVVVEVAVENVQAAAFEEAVGAVLGGAEGAGGLAAQRDSAGKFRCFIDCSGYRLSVA